MRGTGRGRDRSSCWFGVSCRDWSVVVMNADASPGVAVNPAAGLHTDQGPTEPVPERGAKRL